MTKISLIHAVPSGEYPDRGKQVAAMQPIPYLSLTTGEMRLSLLRQRLELLRRFYPEEKQFEMGVEMVDDALKSGVHRGVNFIGVISDQLQPIARMIAQSVRQTRPAAGVIYARPNIVQGIGEVIPIEARKAQCYKEADYKASQYKDKPYREYMKDLLRRKCDQKFEIEKIINDRIEGVGHHVIYKNISPYYKVIPSIVHTKRLLHGAGIGAMAFTMESEESIMAEWVENAIMYKNASKGAGPLDSITSSFYLAPDPEAQLSQYKAWLVKTKQDKINGIGLDPLTISIVIGLIGAALKVAAEFIAELQKAKYAAMASAQGFGTTSYQAEKSDFILDPVNNPPQEVQTDKTLLYAAMAAGAYFLMQD